MSKFLALTSQKGGVMKSTLAVNLAVAFAIHGARVMVVDGDPQANATYSLGAPAGEEECLQAFLAGQPQRPPIQTVSVYQETDEKGQTVRAPVTVDVIPAWITMGLLERWDLLKKNGLPPDPHRVGENVRHAIGNRYDWVLIDSPPHFGYWKQVVLEMTDKVLIPVSQSGNYPLVGLKQMISTIDAVRTSSNHRLRLLGIVSTMVDNRTLMGRQLKERIRASLQKDARTLFDTEIPRATAVEWSQATKGNNLFDKQFQLDTVTNSIVDLMEEVETRWPNRG